MPRGDGTGPDGKGPKNVNKGMPTPRKDGSGQGNGNRCGRNNPNCPNNPKNKTP